MSDERLRELERRFRASGSVEDEAAWLRARVQAGELSSEKLELAAYCGWEAACAATGTMSKQVTTIDDLLTLGRGLESFSRESQTRAALAAVLLLPQPEAWALPHVNACVLAVTQWLFDQTNDNALVAFQAGRDVADSCGHAFDVYRMFCWTPCGSETAARLMNWPSAEPVASCLAYSWHLLGVCLVEALRTELVPWALGYSDPVKERVEAREVAGE